VGKLYDIEKHIYAHEYEQGRQRALSLVSELGAFINRESRHSPLVGKALAYIRENYGSAGLSLNNLSENLHANPSHLSRTFKKETGETVTEYINRTRIEKAKELLTFTSLLSYEVSEAVGFNDYTYFSSVFKKITGVSPKDFKNG
jgi:two-component system response regulator YesN